MEPYLIAIIVIGSIIVIGVIIFVSVYFTLGSSVVTTKTPVSNVTIVPTEVITPSPTPVDGDRMKLLLPLYIYPAWDSVLVQNNPENLIAIMNPNSGPGDSYDSEYANAVANVIGYIATNYSSNGNISNLLQQVSNYNSWYGVNGIFYDEMSTQASNVSFYQNLYYQTKVVLSTTANLTNAPNTQTYKSNSNFTASAINSNIMYSIDRAGNMYVYNVSNAFPEYISSSVFIEVGAIDQYLYLSNNCDYLMFGSGICSITNNTHVLLVSNSISEIEDRACVNDSSSLFFHGNGNGGNMFIYNLPSFTNNSNVNLRNYFSFIDTIDTYGDKLLIYGRQTLDNSSNLLICSGALNANVTVLNSYPNLFVGRHRQSILDVNRKYVYFMYSNLTVVKLEGNTCTLTYNLSNSSILKGNLTNDGEYLFLQYAPQVDLYKSNLDIPYKIATYTEMYGEYQLVFNSKTNVLYYYTIDLTNNLSANFFTYSNSNYTVVGNPGTNTIEEYASASDILVVYEGSNFSEYSSSTWQSNFSKDKFAALVYDSNEIQMMQAVQISNQSLGSIYVTDDDLPNPWDTIPNYYSLESNLINNNIV